MFQDSGDRSLKTQAKFMVRSRAWITDPQRLTGGTQILKLGRGSVIRSDKICVHKGHCMLRWAPEDMEVSPARGFCTVPKSKLSFLGRGGVLLYDSRISHMEGFKSMALGMDT